MTSTQKNKETVGFIGVGFMGHGMAKNIIEKGYPLTVLGHRNRAPITDLVTRGAVEAHSAAELAAASTVIFLCVSNSREVEKVVHGEGGLKSGLRKGTIIIDCSTSDPSSTTAIEAELKALGVDYADAPLGGTPKEAWAGTLSTMVGANDAAFARIEPILNTWAAKVVHLGPVGNGHRMKLLNNFLAMGYSALYSEAITLAMKVGIPPQMFDSVIRGGRMDSGFYQTFMKWTLEGDPEAHKFTIANAFKDMRYLESMADSVNLANPIGNAVKNSYATAAAAGGLEDYIPMLVDYVARANGVELPPKPGRTND